MSVQPIGSSRDLLLPCDNVVVPNIKYDNYDSVSDLKSVISALNIPDPCRRSFIDALAQFHLFDPVDREDIVRFFIEKLGMSHQDADRIFRYPNGKWRINNDVIPVKYTVDPSDYSVINDLGPYLGNMTSAGVTVLQTDPDTPALIPIYNGFDRKGDDTITMKRDSIRDFFVKNNEVRNLLLSKDRKGDRLNQVYLTLGGIKQRSAMSGNPFSYDIESDLYLTSRSTLLIRDTASLIRLFNTTFKDIYSEYVNPDLPLGYRGSRSREFGPGGDVMRSTAFLITILAIDLPLWMPNIPKNIDVVISVAEGLVIPIRSDFVRAGNLDLHYDILPEIASHIINPMDQGRFRLVNRDFNSVMDMSRMANVIEMPDGYKVVNPYENSKYHKEKFVIVKGNEKVATFLVDISRRPKHGKGNLSWFDGLFDMDIELNITNLLDRFQRNVNHWSRNNGTKRMERIIDKIGPNTILRYDKIDINWTTAKLSIHLKSILSYRTRIYISSVDHDSHLNEKVLLIDITSGKDTLTLKVYPSMYFVYSVKSELGNDFPDVIEHQSSLSEVRRAGDIVPRLTNLMESMGSFSNTGDLSMDFYLIYLSTIPKLKELILDLHEFLSI